MTTKITDYDTSAANNTSVDSISLAEGWLPATVNNLIRAFLSQVAKSAQAEAGWLELQTGITAGTTQTQAGATAITSPLANVTTCANANDGVALPANVAEVMVFVINNGAQDMKIWPASGASDTIDGGSADAVDANVLPAGKSRIYLAIDGTDWVTLSPDVDLSPYLPLAGGTMTGDIVMGSGDGIDFSAAGGNILNYYEADTYTPTLVCNTSGSYTVGTATKLAFTKVGRMVNVQGQIQITGETSPSGTLRLSLPFTIGALTEDADISHQFFYLQAHGDAGIENPMLAFAPGLAYAFLVNVTDAGVQEAIDESRVDTGFYISVNVNYIAA